MTAQELVAALERFFDDGARLREQRRYEIARDVMAAGYADPERGGHVSDRAALAVRAADALLAKLDAHESGGDNCPQFKERHHA